MYIRRSEDVQDVLCKFNLRPLSTGKWIDWIEKTVVKCEKETRKPRITQKITNYT